jgi:hypothetical protein
MGGNRRDPNAWSGKSDNLPAQRHRTIASHAMFTGGPTMSSTGDFAKMVPGFEFLQGLMKNAGSAIPGMNQWIAPTLDPAELDKRIDELRTVQFWLEQNARMLATTIQALEVQRMTLSTLKSMNVPVADVAEAFKIKTPPAPVREPAPEPAPAPPPAAPKGAAQPEAAGVVDPMQWWGALTQQFTELAARTLKEGAADAARSMAAVKTAAAAKPAPASRKAAPAKSTPSAKAGRASTATKATRTRRAG